MTKSYGTLKLEMDWLGDDLPGHVPVTLENGDKGHLAIAQVIWTMEQDSRMKRNSPECEAFAHRLVACWNYCSEIDTKKLLEKPPRID